MPQCLRELGVFFWRQIQASVFPLFLFATMAFTEFTTLGLPRYDLLLILSLAMQVFMVRSGLETLNELKMVTAFHLLGLGLELYKVSHGSWSYPDAGFKIGGVPLYSGFMYASVASYMMQGWRRFELELVAWPNPRWLFLTAIAIYLNFFLAKTFGDVRWWILAVVLAVFFKAKVLYTTFPGLRREMPILLAFGLIGLFVWFAEHLCTWLHAWEYPYQHGSWTFVDVGKLSSWLMMVIISFVVVAQVKRLNQGQSRRQEQSGWENSDLQIEKGTAH